MTGDNSIWKRWIGIRVSRERAISRLISPVNFVIRSVHYRDWFRNDGEPSAQFTFTLLPLNPRPPLHLLLNCTEFAPSLEAPLSARGFRNATGKQGKWAESTARPPWKSNDYAIYVHISYIITRVKYTPRNSPSCTPTACVYTSQTEIFMRINLAFSSDFINAVATRPVITPPPLLSYLRLTYTPATREACTDFRIITHTGWVHWNG